MSWIDLFLGFGDFGARVSDFGLLSTKASEYTEYMSICILWNWFYQWFPDLNIFVVISIKLFIPARIKWCIEWDGLDGIRRRFNYKWRGQGPIVCVLSGGKVQGWNSPSLVPKQNSRTWIPVSTVDRKRPRCQPQTQGELLSQKNPDTKHFYFLLCPRSTKDASWLTVKARIYGNPLLTLGPIWDPWTSPLRTIPDFKLDYNLLLIIELIVLVLSIWVLELGSLGLGLWEDYRLGLKLNMVLLNVTLDNSLSLALRTCSHRMS